MQKYEEFIGDNQMNKMSKQTVTGMTTILIIAGIILFKNPICLLGMDLVDFIGNVFNINTVEIIDFLNNIYYL